MNNLKDIFAQNMQQNVWIIFSGESSAPWMSWIFKKGFRHCYVIINDGNKWVICDPLAHKLELSVHHQIPAKFNLPDWLKGRGLKVMPVKDTYHKRKTTPPVFFTCVEAVKRIIGLRKVLVFTPYQLFCYLERHETLVKC